MTNDSLQSWEASLLYSILHLEQECNMLDSCSKHVSPSKEGCTSFEGSPAFLKKHVIFRKGLWKGSCNYIDGIKVQIRFNILIPNLCVFGMIPDLLTLMYLLLHCIHSGQYNSQGHSETENMALHGDRIELDYIQELLNKHLTFWFVGNFL